MKRILGLYLILSLLYLSGCSDNAADNTEVLTFVSPVSEIQSSLSFTPVSTPYPMIISTPSPLLIRNTSEDIIKIMEQLEATDDYDELLRLKTEYAVESFQLYHNIDAYHHIHYITFTDNFEIEGVYKGQSPEEIKAAHPASRLVEYTNRYSPELSEIYQSLITYLESQFQSGVIVIVPLNGLSLVGVAANKNSPLTEMALFKYLPPDGVSQILMAYSNKTDMPADLYFTEPQLRGDEGIETFHVNLIKKTVSHGEVILRSFDVNRLTYSVFSDPYSLHLGETMIDLDRYANPPIQKRKIVFHEYTYNIDDFLVFDIQDDVIVITDRIDGEIIQIPVSSRLLKNLVRFTSLYDEYQLFVIESLPNLDKEQQQVYALKAQYGWKMEYWTDISEKTYFDIATLTFKYDNNKGMPTDLEIMPKFTTEQASIKKDLSVNDLQIGPMTACMKPDKFLLAIEQEGVDEKEVERLKDFFKKSYFGSFEYNGFTARHHSLANCIPGFIYKGSSQNYKTSRGIAIGNTKEEVQIAYGLPDIGLMENDTWFYLLDKPYWMSDEGHLKEPEKHFGDGMTFIFEDNKLISIECSVFISSS